MKAKRIYIVNCHESGNKYKKIFTYLHSTLRVLNVSSKLHILDKYFVNIWHHISQN